MRPVNERTPQVELFLHPKDLKDFEINFQRLYTEAANRQRHSDDSGAQEIAKDQRVLCP